MAKAVIILTTNLFGVVLMGLLGCASITESSTLPETAQETAAVAAQIITPDVQIEIPATNTNKENPSSVTSATDSAKVTSIGPQAGKLAPDFTFSNSEGKIVSLTSLRGSFIIMNFWATWCSPCKYEMPLFQDLADDKEKANKGLILLTIDVGESADTVQNFLQNSGYSFTVLLDNQKKIAYTYYVRSYPTTFFISQNGIIDSIKIGAFLKKSELEQHLDALIKSGS